MYEGLKKPVRQALATSAIQNPDVIYKFIDKRGNSHWTVENGESVVTIYTKSAPQEQLSAVLGHEIAHHIDAFGFMPQILEQLVGSVEKGKPGIFTEYKNGKPVIIKDAEGRDVYATNEEFAKHRERYLDLLEKSGTDKKHPDYQAYANDDARIAREIFASHGAAWYFGGDFVTRNYQGAGAKMMGAILEPLFSSPGLRKFFHRIGLATQENTGLVADPLNLFPGLKEIPQLTRMIEKYNDDVRGFGPQARREGRGRGNLVDPAFADEIATVNLTAKDLENTAIVDRLKAGGVVKIKDDGTIETDAEGRPVFLPTREVNKKNKQLSNDILSIIRKKEDAGETFGEGHVALEKTADGRDRATGRFLDPSIIDELAQTGRYNPHQLAALKQISQTLRNDTGDVWNLFYYSALKYNKAGRKVYGQIKGGDRKSLPFGIEITKDGNINIQTISLEAFRKNLDWFAKSKGYEQKMAEAFQGMNAYENVQNAMKLLPTYLQNHMKGVINGSKGSGITPLQRDLINASIGRINADQVKANPVLEGLGDRRSQRQQSIRSRRLDRIGNAIRGESGLPAFKSAIEQNKVPMYMPKPEADVQITDKLFMPARDQKGYSIIERPAKHFGDGFQKFRITHDESDGFIEVVVKPNGTSSVTQLLVPESFRRQGIGRSLQEKAQELYPNLGGQVSSKYAAKSAYDLGRRPPDNPKATLEEVFKAIDQDSSVNLVSQNQDKLFMPASEAGAGKGKQAEAAKLWNEKGTDSPYFKKYSEGAKIVKIGEQHDFVSGEPVVVEGVHGSTHTFKEFDPSKANPESDLGKAIYISNTPDEVGVNYAGEGPDLTGRIERKAETYMGMVEDELSSYGLSEDATQQQIEAKSYELARNELVGEGPQTYRVFAKFKNPVVVGEKFKSIDDFRNRGGKKETNFEMMFDEDAGTESGTLVDLLEQVDEVAYNFEFVDVDKVKSDIMEAADYDSIGAQELIKTMKESEGLMDTMDADGELANGEFVRQVFEGMGFDGIIDLSVNEKFGSQRKMGRSMEGMNPDTIHYLAFKPEQIKSATGNRGTFDAGERNINYMPADSKAPKAQPANRITRQAPAMPGNRFMLPAATAGAKSAERFR
jgi:GNAT superfamily N-acetyltransferase